MAREILDKDREAEVYHSSLVRTRAENARLKKMLKDNGIEVKEGGGILDTSPASTQPQAVS